MKFLFSFFFCLPLFFVNAKHHEILHLPGNDEPGKGKTIVLVAGDEEYRTEESMPMLAKILSQKHGFECKVLFAWDKEGKYIDPNNQQGVRGWHHLKDADLMIIGTRFRRPSEDEAKHITEFLNAGKPVIGIRTSTHAFTGSGSFGGKISYGQFGPLVMGEGWVSHHGRHKVEGARGVIEAKNADHPIIKGVTDVFGPSDVYGIKRPTDKDTILSRERSPQQWIRILLLWNQKMSLYNPSLGFIPTLRLMGKRVQPFVLPWEPPSIWLARISVE